MTFNKNDVNEEFSVVFIKQIIKKKKIHQSPFFCSDLRLEFDIL
jgi:hypothetical protein